MANAWGELVLLAVHTVILLGLSVVVVVGPPPRLLVPVPAPAPKAVRFLFFKLLYWQYWPTVRRFSNIANKVRERGGGGGGGGLPRKPHHATTHSPPPTHQQADADESAEPLGIKDLPTMVRASRGKAGLRPSLTPTSNSQFPMHTAAAVWRVGQACAAETPVFWRLVAITR